MIIVVAEYCLLFSSEERMVERSSGSNYVVINTLTDQEKNF